MRGISWLAANQSAAQEGLCTMEYQSFRRSWDDNSLTGRDRTPLPQPSSPLPSASTWPSPFPLYQLFALLAPEPLETFTSFFQLSAFTQLPVMKGGRGTPGELMNVSIATQSFRYEILPDVWACTLCAPHTFQTTAFGSSIPSCTAGLPLDFV